MNISFSLTERNAGVAEREGKERLESLKMMNGYVLFVGETAQLQVNVKGDRPINDRNNT